MHLKAESRESHLSRFLSIKITNCNKIVTVRSVNYAENGDLLLGQKDDS